MTDRLRDFTDGPRVLPVEVVWAPAHEVLTALWALADKEHASSHDDGGAFYDDVMARIDSPLRARFEALAHGYGAVWLAALGLVASVGEQPTADDMADAIEADEVAFKARLLEVLPCHSTLDPARAVTDRDTLDELLAEVISCDPGKAASVEHIREWIDLPSGEFATEVAAVLRGMAGALEEHLQSVAAGLTRDAEATAALALTMAPERVVEHATKGIAYQPQPGVERLRLVPSAVVRPWSLMIEHDRVRYFIYPAGDEFLEGDPDAPPAWLIKTYKALADEKRLRILSRIGRGGATLGELAELVGAAKSTVHHHIGILRSAGLIRVELSEGKDTTYRLRTEVLPAAEHLLARYLSGETQ